MSDTKRTAGENAAQKLVRLLANFNREMVEEGSGDEIEVRFSGDGGGNLILVGAEGIHASSSLYGFESLDDLARYLEMTPLNRLLASIARPGAR
jgi:hypothetical protein